jgi:hypothetical protein
MRIKRLEQTAIQSHFSLNSIARRWICVIPRALAPPDSL